MFNNLLNGIKRLFRWRIKPQDAPPNSSPTDSYFQKLVTYVPADIIAAWVALSGVISSSGTTTPHWLTWAVFGALLTLIPFYVCYLKTTPPGLTSNKIFYWLTSCLAFVAWVFALGGPFLALAWYRPVYGSVVLILVTLTIPVLEGVFVTRPPAVGGGTSGGGAAGTGTTGSPASDGASPPSS